MQLDWAIHTSVIEKRLSHSYQLKHYMWFYDFFVTQDYYNCNSVSVNLVLQYYSAYKNENFEYSFCIVWWNVAVLIECFHLQNETLVNGFQDISEKTRFAGNHHVYQAPESSSFSAACAFEAHEALFIF